MSIQKMWNEKFSREGFLYGTKPNAFLAKQSEHLPSQATVLMLGEGEGRTACYLSASGFKVSALDASDIGLKKTEALSKELGVEVETILADLEVWKSEKTYDAILTSFLHLPEPLRSKAFHHALDILKPGGYFMGEFFALAQLNRDSGGPKMPELLYTLASVQNIFNRDDVTLVTLEACTDVLDEGVGHQGKADLIRVIVQKNK